MSTDRDYLAAGLALGGLSDSELAEAQVLAESDADFRAEVASYSDVMAEAAESDEPVESARRLARRFCRSQNHAQESAQEPVLRRRQPPRRRPHRPVRPRLRRRR